MIFPTSSSSSLLLLIAAMVCLASWVLPHRLTFKWRFELFYYDVTWGVLIGAVVAAFTLGTMSSQELTFQDNMILTGYRKMAWSTAAGGVYNLANLLLIAAVVLSRMSLAFPTALGTALIMGTIWDYAGSQRGNLVLLGIGILALAIAIGLEAMSAMAARSEASAVKGPVRDPRVPAPKTQEPSGPNAGKPVRGLIFGLCSGILFGLANPMITEAVSDENGVSAYGAILLFAVGWFLSSFFYVPIFMNFPIQGNPVALRQYFKGAQKNHIWGVLAGFLLIGGLLAQLVVRGAIPSAQVSPLFTSILGGSVAALAAIWGLFAIREYKAFSSKVLLMGLAGVVVFLVGVGLIGFGKTS